MTFISFFEKGNTSWMKNAACKPDSVVDARDKLNLFFPPERGSTSALAKQLCSRCEVADDCYEYAKENGQRNGVWGGVVMSERPSRQKKRKSS